MNKIKKLRSQADKLWQEIIRLITPRCVVCGKQTQVGHHYFPKSIASSLRYNLSNGIGLCNICHFKLHNGDPTIQAKILEVKGQEWHDELVESRKKKIKITIKYFEHIIEVLKEYIIYKNG